MQYKQWLPADDMATVKDEILTDVKKRVLQNSKFVFVFVFNGINEDGKIVHFTCEPEKDPMIMRIKKDNYLTLTCTKNIEWHHFYDRMFDFITVADGVVPRLLGLPAPYRACSGNGARTPTTIASVNYIYTSISHSI